MHSQFNNNSSLKKQSLSDTPALEEKKLPFLECCLFRDIIENYKIVCKIYYLYRYIDNYVKLNKQLNLIELKKEEGNVCVWVYVFGCVGICICVYVCAICVSMCDACAQLSYQYM